MANGFSRDRLARLHHGLAAHVAAADMPGVVALVSRHGEVHVEAAGTQSFDGPPMKRDTIFRIASMTKPVIAAVTLMLVEEGKLRLDDPVDAFLPELADRKVLGSIDGAVDDTVPARRPITARDLLTFTFGMGAVMVWPAQYPIQHAAAALGLAPGPFPPDYTADEFMKRLGWLPLFYQPGERWLYHTGSDVLGVLIARVTGQPLETVLRERLFAPLGMRDTGFQVPAAKLDRFASAYMMDPQEKKLRFFDDAANSHWSKPPKFASGGGGLVSTVDDVHAFYRMMIGYGLPRGEHSGERLLARPTVELMMSDQLTSEQKQDSSCSSATAPAGAWAARCHTPERYLCYARRFGWDGGRHLGQLDPAEDMIGILMTQRLMDYQCRPGVPRFLDGGLSGLQRLGTFRQECAVRGEHYLRVLTEEKNHERAALYQLRRPRPGGDRFLQVRARRHGRHDHAFQGRPARGAGQHDSESKDKVMHAAFRIGDTQVMASDGFCTGSLVLGASLTLNAASNDEADTLFKALSQGGKVNMPMSETFFANRFGVVADKFGVNWMVIHPKDHG